MPAETPRPTIEGIAVGRGAAGDPLVSATFVIGADNRVERGVLQLALELGASPTTGGGPDLGGEGSPPTLPAEGTRLELRRTTIDDTGSGGAVALDATVATAVAPDGDGPVTLDASLAGPDASALLDALLSGGSEFEVVARAGPVEPPPPTRARVALGELWAFLDRLVDGSRRITTSDLLAHLPRLVALGTVQVQSGADDAPAVLDAVLRGASFVLRPADGAYLLSPSSPGDAVAVTSGASPAWAEPAARRVDLAELVGPAIAHRPDDFVHAVSASGTPVELATAINRRASGPVLDDPSARLWPDRGRSDRSWCLPDLCVVLPDPARPVDDDTPFRFDVIGSTAAVTITLEGRHPWTSGLGGVSVLPMTPRSVRLVLPYRDDDGRSLTEELPASRIERLSAAVPANQRLLVRFDLEERWVAAAYDALATAGLHTEVARLLATFEVDGWQDGERSSVTVNRSCAAYFPRVDLAGHYRELAADGWRPLAVSRGPASRGTRL